MTITKTPVSLLNAVAGAGGTTKAAPGADSGWVDVSGIDGGTIGLKITNGASAPSPAGNLLIQQSPDNGVTAYDYYGPLTSDTVASSDTSATIDLDPGVKYVRVIGYGNGTNPVTYTATLTEVTRA